MARTPAQPPSGSHSASAALPAVPPSCKIERQDIERIIAQLGSQGCSQTGVSPLYRQYLRNQAFATMIKENGVSGVSTTPQMHGIRALCRSFELVCSPLVGAKSFISINCSRFRQQRGQSYG